MKPLLERLRVSRLASIFTILGTLSAGILIGSVAVHGVRGNETQTDSSDATPLKIPNPVSLSTTFTQIAKDVGPAVVNINTETLPQEDTHSRRRTPHGAVPAVPPGGGDDDQNGDQDGAGPDQNFQDFFNRFFGGQGQGGGPEGGGDQMRESLGSGFIVDSRGYIITNNHVVEKADKIFVKLSTDPEGFQGRLGKVIGVDKDTDLAVVKITTTEPLPSVKMGNSDSGQVVTGSSRLAARLRSRRRLRPESSRPRTAPLKRVRLASSNTSFRQMRRSTRATPVGRWSTWRTRSS